MNPSDDELMIKNRIPSSYVRGLVVDVSMKEGFLEGLRREGIVVKDDKGIETINDIPIEKFVHFVDSKTTTFQIDWWDRD